MSMSVKGEPGAAARAGVHGEPAPGLAVTVQGGAAAGAASKLCLAGAPRPRPPAEGLIRAGQNVAQALLAKKPLRPLPALRPAGFTVPVRGYHRTAASGVAPAAARSVAARTGPALTGAPAAPARAALTAPAARAASARAPLPAQPSLTATSKELAFLDDKHLSFEDKLFMFMLLMEKKSEKEMKDKMKEYDAKYGHGGGTPSTTAPGTTKPPEAKPPPKQGGGGIGGFLGGLVGKVVGGVEAIAKQVGGPLLAAAATACGAPFLAPVALSVGGELSAGILDGVATWAGLKDDGGAAKSPSGQSLAATDLGSAAQPLAAATSAGSATSAKKEITKEEEWSEKSEYMQLQRMMDKANTMYALVSNMLKAMHDTHMVAVNNIR